MNPFRLTRKGSCPPPEDPNPFNRIQYSSLTNLQSPSLVLSFPQPSFRLGIRPRCGAPLAGPRTHEVGIATSRCSGRNQYDRTNAPAQPQQSRATDIQGQNHPATDLPAYFVHPCNTADAMSEIIQGNQISPQVYLQIWIGLVGSGIGLYLPSQLIAGNLQDG